MAMKKFAFLVHLRSSYRKDLGILAPPLGWIPDSAYRYAFKNRPFAPFIWSDVYITNTPEPDGHIIMLPYTGRQLLEQQKAMIPRIEQALALAASKRAELVGLGALTSPITLGGKLLVNNPHVAITNGNAYTSVITFQKISELIRQSPKINPTIALVGATGSVGTLVSLLLAKYHPACEYMLVARNERKINQLASEMGGINSYTATSVSLNIDDVKRADIVVLLTSAPDSLLHAHHLKRGAVVLDDTQPRNTHPDILKHRPDLTVIDGGLVSVPSLKLRNHIGLPQGLSYACLAETMLLAQAGHQGHFSIGNPTLTQADYISEIAHRFSSLGFGVAPDHSFGQRIHKPVISHSVFDAHLSRQVA